MGISERGGAFLLEILRVACWLACMRAVIMVPATELIFIERLARTLAPDHVPRGGSEL